jgi:hypothetical protein
MGTITLLNTKPYKEQPVPEVGKEYHTFDDGKIKPSRHSITTITKVIPFNKCNDNELMSDWADEVTECYWLYANETDYFVEGRYDDETNYFVRTKDGGWFSLGFFGARLDIDGSLYNSMIEQFGEDCLND